MPKSLDKLSQPALLEDMALDTLVACAVRYCDELSVERFATRLRQGVPIIKKHLNNSLPTALFTDFCIRFLNTFYTVGSIRSKARPASHHRAVLEIAMDVKTLRLDGVGSILGFLDPRDAHRLYGLMTLNASYFPNSVSLSLLGNLKLNHLTALYFQNKCSDLHLRVIGTKCLQLQILRISYSEEVTDKGLHALRQCPELRVVDVFGCLNVSHAGLNEMLSVHKKIATFAYGEQIELQLSAVAFQLDSSDQCPSMNRFVNDSIFDTDEQIQSLARKFPNLSCLRFYGHVNGDLCELKYLKLTELDFNRSHGFKLRNLKQLLTFIGGNMTHLRLHMCEPRVYLSQIDLDFIHKYCRNLETLGIDFIPNQNVRRLIVPPFRKLKVLECLTSLEYTIESNIGIEFDRMLELVRIGVYGFHVTAEHIEAMILDNAKFPNLAVLEMSLSKETSWIGPRIMKIARNNNLDFLIKPFPFLPREAPLGIV